MNLDLISSHLLAIFFGIVIGLIIGHWLGVRSEKPEVIVFKIKDL